MCWCLLVLDRLSVLFPVVRACKYVPKHIYKMQLFDQW